MKVSPGKDPLIVDETPMMRSQAKRVNEAMWLLIQATIDETSILASKGTSFVLGSKEKTSWFNAIQATDEVTGQSNYVAT